jgi:hypothetical protein
MGTAINSVLVAMNQSPSAVIGGCCLCHLDFTISKTTALAMNSAGMTATAANGDPPWSFDL